MSRKRTFASICSDLNSLGLEVLSPESEYFHTKTKITVRGQCGHEWQATFSNLKFNSRGCPKCKAQKTSELKRLGPEYYEQSFINAGFEVIGDIDKDIIASTYVKLKCNKGHLFELSPDRISSGRGCPGCSINNFRADIPAFLYIFRSKCGKIMKIGITHDIQGRASHFFNESGIEFDLIYECAMIGSTARTVEKHLKGKFDRFEVGMVKGYTEIFHFDASAPQIAWETVMMYD